MLPFLRLICDLLWVIFLPWVHWTRILFHILSKYVVVNVWWVATNASFTSFNLRFNLGHFFAQGPLTYLNLNIAAIRVTNPWVSIQINFWGSVPPAGEVLHTCKIIYYF